MILPSGGKLTGVGSSSSAHRLATVTVAGLGLYLAVSVLLFRLRTDYSLLHDAESDYAVGGWSRLMDVAFLVRGGFSAALILALAYAVPASARSEIGVALLWIWSVGSGLLAFFPTDLEGQEPATAAGGVHLILALAAFLAAPVGQLAIAWRLRYARHWRPVLPVLLALPVLAAAAFVLLLRTRLAPHSLDGLWERVFLACVLVWLLVAALRILTLHRLPVPV